MPVPSYEHNGEASDFVPEEHATTDIPDPQRTPHNGKQPFGEL